jgi:hypothetical protein
VEDRTCASPFAFDIGATTVADHILLLQAAQASGSKPPPMWFINSIMDNGSVCCTQTAQWLHFILLRSSPPSILYASTLTIPTTTSLLLLSHFFRITSTQLHLVILRAYLAITCTSYSFSLPPSSSACASFVGRLQVRELAIFYPTL